MNMQIIRYSSSQEVVFRSQFLSYFLEDLKIPLTPRQVNEKICIFLLRQVEKGIVFLDLLYRDETPIGFCLYQIDKKESDWCKREGWGFIREFYIEQSERRQSCGTYLCRAVEKRLYEMGQTIFILPQTAPFLSGKPTAIVRRSLQIWKESLL